MPSPIYVGMITVGQRPMAIIEGARGAMGVGTFVEDAQIVEITPRMIKIQRGSLVKQVTLDTNPARHKEAPPPPRPHVAAAAFRRTQRVSTPPSPPPPPAQPYFVPVAGAQSGGTSEGYSTAPHYPVVDHLPEGGSGSSR